MLMNVKAVALTTPAVRMMVVEAWAWTDAQATIQTGHAVHEVAAIRATIDPEGYEWVDPLFYEPEYGRLISPSQNDCTNAVLEVVVTPWPREEDGERALRT